MKPKSNKSILLWVSVVGSIFEAGAEPLSAMGAAGAAGGGSGGGRGGGGGGVVEVRASALVAAGVSRATAAGGAGEAAAAAGEAAGAAAGAEVVAASGAEAAAGMNADVGLGACGSDVACELRTLGSSCAARATGGSEPVEGGGCASLSYCISSMKLSGSSPAPVQRRAPTSPASAWVRVRAL